MPFGKSSRNRTLAARSQGKYMHPHDAERSGVPQFPSPRAASLLCDTSPGGSCAFLLVSTVTPASVSHVTQVREVLVYSLQACRVKMSLCVLVVASVKRKEIWSLG